MEGKEILLCLTGGIACYKVADLASKLTQRGAGVTCAMTQAAREFLAPLTLEVLTNRPVHLGVFDRVETHRPEHIALSDRADLVLIAPATANCMAKLANGIADDVVSTLALSAQGSCEILLAPAMNTRMWDAPATQRNRATLLEDGVHLVGPAEGHLACGTSGVGRMAEVVEILAAAEALLSAS
ncbi:MAG: phosphopantothenoylcysteine decarboxylase [Phycisphaerales bacterium]|nr:phosphopantothenoylcysteine decarboxylase [Phycisphaerales bacterium]MBT7170932.1 phosphopantothenoylcysteine decarboxylase [Phycisphaerales bacterium]